MSHLPITNSLITTDERIDQTVPKRNARKIAQDDSQPAKRVKSTSEDDSWDFALANPLPLQATLNQPNQVYFNNLSNYYTELHPETHARLIVEFTPLILIKIFTYLNVRDICALIGTCKFGNSTLKDTFYEQANRVNNLLYQRDFKNTLKQSQALTIKLLEESRDELEQKSTIAMGLQILDEIHAGLKGKKAMTIEAIRKTFDESYFDGDEMAFMKHVVSFNDPIYQQENKSMVKRFVTYAHNLKMNCEDSDYSFSISEHRHFEANSNYPLSFFPLRIIQNPHEIDSLTLVDMRIKTLPPQIKDCVNLQHLTVQDIHYLPAEIGDLTSLKSLELKYHHVKTLPDSIVKLTNLHVISFEADDVSVQENFTFDELTHEQQAWLRTLKQNGCVIEMMDVPEEG